MGNQATLSVPTTQATATRNLEHTDPVYDRKNSQFVFRVRLVDAQGVGQCDWIPIYVPIGPAAKNSLDTAIAAAIKAALAGNPDVTLP